MSDTQKQNNRPALSVGELRQKLAQADAARRELLAQILLGFSGDIGPLVALLVNEAHASTLSTLEALLLETGNQ